MSQSKQPNQPQIPTRGVAQKLSRLFNRTQTGSFWTVRRKLFIPVITLVVLGTVGLIGYNQYVSSQKNSAQEAQELERLKNTFLAEIQSTETLALGLATSAANNPEVQAAFAAGDRERLTELMLQTYETANKEFAVKQFQFVSPPATSFLRLHQLDKYGDDLSQFRFTVLEANNTKQSVRGPEIGRAGLGVRGEAPVFYLGRHIGVVDVGIDIGDAFLERIKQEYGVDAQLLLNSKAAEVATFSGFVEGTTGPTDDLLYQAGTLSKPIYADASVYPRVLNGESVISRLKVGDRYYLTISFPLIDFSGKDIGVVEIILDRTDLEAAERRSLLTSLLSTLMLIIVGGFIYFQIIRYVLRPVTVLTEAASAIANGKLDQNIPVTSRDEIGALAETFNSMSAQLRGLIGSLEQRVEARTRDLATVAEVSSATSTILEADRLLQEVVDLSKERFNLYHSHIYLLDEEGENLVLAAGAGEPGRIMTAEKRSIPLDREQSLVARAARERKGIIVNDVTQAPDFLPNPFLPDTRSELAVPMIVSGKVIGVFDIQSDTAGRFAESDINIQTTLATQVATFVQNVRLFEQFKKKADFESMVNVISQKIQRAVSVDDVLQTTVRELGNALGARNTRAILKSPALIAPQDERNAE